MHWRLRVLAERVGALHKNLPERVFRALVTAAFVRNPNGAAYGVGRRQKRALAARIAKVIREVESASLYEEHLMLTNEVLAVPPEVNGVVAEFGCFRGASSASLSLACSLTNRRLCVFDSFAGLPVSESASTVIGRANVPYRAGEYCAGIDEVKRNIAKVGCPDVCDFIEGRFDQLSARNEQYALIFEDADLPSSVMAVLRFAWPRLRAGGKFFCHEARDYEVVRLFFDDEWWRRTLGGNAPGLTGSGLGLPLHWSCALGGDNILKAGSHLAFAVKPLPEAESRYVRTPGC